MYHLSLSRFHAFQIIYRILCYSFDSLSTLIIVYSPFVFSEIVIVSLFKYQSSNHPCRELVTQKVQKTT